MTFICMKVESGLIFYNIAEVQAHKRPVLFTPECSSGCNCTQKSLSHSADGRWEALAASLRPQIPVPKLPGSDQWDPGCETACMLPQKRPARKWTALPNACLHNPSTTHTHTLYCETYEPKRHNNTESACVRQPATRNQARTLSRMMELIIQFSICHRQRPYLSSKGFCVFKMTYGILDIFIYFV